MAFQWITPVDVKPGTADAWTDVDLSAVIQSGATMALLEIEITASVAFGYRQNGSTDDRRPTFNSAHHLFLFVGVDGARICELYLGTSVANFTVFCHGSVGAEGVWKTNAPAQSRSTTTWEDWDLSGQSAGDPMTGAIVEIAWSANTSAGVRCNGSTDNRVTGSLQTPTNQYVRKADASEIIETSVADNTRATCYLNGYITGGVTWNVNAVDRSLAATLAWTDLPTALAAGKTGGLFEVFGGGGARDFGLRKNGSGDNRITQLRNDSSSGFAAADASGIIEGYIESTGVDFWLHGETDPGAVTGAAVLEGAGELGAAALVKVFGQAVVDGLADMGVAGALTVLGSAVIEGVGEMAVLGRAGFAGAAVIEGIGEMLASGALTVLGSAVIEGRTVLKVRGGPWRPGAVADLLVLVEIYPYQKA